MHPLEHAKSSAEKFGGMPEDYQAIHDWFDASKEHFADIRHRALRHHAQGIFWAEEVFGKFIVNSDGKQVPVRFIGEQHVKEDLGHIPTLTDWLRSVRLAPWMRNNPRLAKESPESVQPVQTGTSEESP